MAHPVHIHGHGVHVMKMEYAESDPDSGAILRDNRHVTCSGTNRPFGRDVKIALELSFFVKLLKKLGWPPCGLLMKYWLVVERRLVTVVQNSEIHYSNNKLYSYVIAQIYTSDCI